LLPRFGHYPIVIGVDLRGKDHNPTGMACCAGPTVEHAILYDDSSILNWIRMRRPELVSIDAPLSLPRGRQTPYDDDPTREAHGIVRDAERLLWSRGIRVYPALIRHMQSLTGRGIALAQAIRDMGIEVIESYPGAAQDVLAIPRKGVATDLLARGLRDFGFDVGDDLSHDELDALTSALVGYFFLAERYEALGAHDENFLIIPRTETMKWAVDSVPTIAASCG
jgi:predicted nuclease with RNAse H fold